MNRTRSIFLLLLTLAFVSVASAQGTKPLRYTQIKYPKLHELKIPEPARYVLGNGLIVYLLEDHTLPTVSARVMVRTGSRLEPADKVGLASITGQVMRTGGTTTKTGDEIDEMLEKVGASVETFIGGSSGGAGISVLTENIDLGLSVLADILRNPAFRDDKIELAKVGMKSGISRRNDNPGSIAGREFTKLIYGPISPLGRQMEYAHIENITKQDMIDFHKKFFVPNNIMLAVWGDFSTEEMKKKIEATFGGWPKSDVSIPPVPKPRMAKERSFYLVKKSDVNQSNIALGHLGGLMNDPDHTGLNLADLAFGGAFASRLFNHVRSQQGLAYSVYSNWGEEYDYPGVFRLGGSTKSGTTVKMVRSILKEFEDVAKNGVTDDELSFAKDSYLNSFVFEYASKAQVINELMLLEYFGYPKDFIQTEQREAQNATKKTLNDAVAARWNPAALTVVVVGNDKEFDEPLSALGPVKEIDITIPAPPEKIPDPTPETTAKGKGLIDRTMNVLGGKKAAAVRDMTVEATMKVTTPMGEMEMKSNTVVLFPNKQHTAMTTPMGAMTMATDGNTGWMKFGGGIRDLPPSQIEETKKELLLDPMIVARNLESADYVIYFFKDDKIGDRPVNVLIVKHKPSGANARWFVDATSGMLLKSVSREAGQQGPQDVEKLYDDYRDVDGVKVAFKTTQFVDGKKQGETTFGTVKLNAGVGEELFKKPAP
jgi:zinc protease